MVFGFRLWSRATSCGKSCSRVRLRNGSVRGASGSGSMVGLDGMAGLDGMDGTVLGGVVMGLVVVIFFCLFRGGGVEAWLPEELG